MLLIREDLVLLGQECTPGIHQVDAGKLVLQSDFLSPEVLLHRHGIVSAALDRGVIGDHQDMASMDQTNARNNPGTRGIIVVHAVRSQGCNLKERAAIIEQVVDAFPRKKLSAGDMPLPGLCRTAEGRRRQAFPQFLHQGQLRLLVGFKGAAGGSRQAGDCLH
ncbi:hypothetical protein D3C73_1160420 [compost metagenome]